MSKSDEFSKTLLVVVEMRRCETRTFPQKGYYTYWDFESAYKQPEMGMTWSPEGEPEPRRPRTIATGPWGVGIVLGLVIGGHS